MARGNPARAAKKKATRQIQLNQIPSLSALGDPTNGAQSFVNRVSNPTQLQEALDRAQATGQEVDTSNVDLMDTEDKGVDRWQDAYPEGGEENGGVAAEEPAIAPPPPPTPTPPPPPPPPPGKPPIIAGKYNSTWISHQYEISLTMKVATPSSKPLRAHSRRTSTGPTYNRRKAVPLALWPGYQNWRQRPSTSVSREVDRSLLDQYYVIYLRAHHSVHLSAGAAATEMYHIDNQGVVRRGNRRGPIVPKLPQGAQTGGRPAGGQQIGAQQTGGQQTGVQQTGAQQTEKDDSDKDGEEVEEQQAAAEEEGQQGRGEDNAAEEEEMDVEVHSSDRESEYQSIIDVDEDYQLDEQGEEGEDDGLE
ncbi:MAG: hypothetical protein Q9179_006842 [Wetmoreana sp. 5 TL-2023]